MNEQEKSIKLAEMCGWFISTPIEGVPRKTDNVWVYRTGGGLIGVTKSPLYLYDSSCMALAWLVLNWAMSNLNELDRGRIVRELLGWEWSADHLLGLPPEKAQRAILDKILELTNETP